MPTAIQAALIAMLAIAASAGGYAVITYDPSPETVLAYYDGDEKISEQIHSGNPELINPYAGKDKTFYGWSTQKDLSGKLLKPGHRSGFGSDAALYAAVVDGKITCDSAGTARYSLENFHGGTAVIDLRYEDCINCLEIEGETMALFAESDSEMKIIFNDGREIILDADAVRECGRITCGSCLCIKFTETGGGMRLEIGASGISLDTAVCGITVIMPAESAEGLEFFRFSEDGEENVRLNLSGGQAVFALNDGTKSKPKGHPIAVLDGNGKTIPFGSPEHPSITVKESPLGGDTLLAEGDVFTINGKPGRKYAVSGAVKTGYDTYRASGSKITVTVTHGQTEYKAILPETQTGYRITADPMSVKEGGTCTITYSLLAGYSDKNKAIKVNGKTVNLDSHSKVTINNVTEDLRVEVSGVHDGKTHIVILPETQTGYRITADPMSVKEGGTCTITYSLLPGYSDKNKTIKVNGRTINLDSFSKAKIVDVTENLRIEVSGVQGTKTYGVTLPETQTGYRITADPMSVKEGGICTITYSLLAGYSDKNKTIKVNGRTVSLDASSKAIISNVTEDLRIEVTGIQGTKTYGVTLPAAQTGYRITADPMSVKEGGTCTITYKLYAGYGDKDKIIKVNGNTVSLDSSSRAIISNVTENLRIEVTGVYDSRVYKITVPEVQTGYSLTASAQTVNHGMSCSISFAVKDGYVKEPGFKVCVNNKILDVSSGTVTINSITANQNITVSGVGMIKHSVISGSNTLLKVNGFPVQRATSEDLITVEPLGDYSIPESYQSHLPNSVRAVEGGYKITGDSVFPSVVRITPGRNTAVSGSEDSIVICAGDRVSVSGSSGYSLPDNYRSKLEAKGASFSEGLYSFSADAELPAVFKVTYNDQGKVFSALFASESDPLPVPGTEPKRKGYTFGGWDIENIIVTGNLNVVSKWSPKSFNVSFGVNLTVVFEKGASYVFTDKTDPSSRRMIISADEKFRVTSVGDVGLPDGYFKSIFNLRTEGSWLYVVGDTIFDGVSNIVYLKENYEVIKTVPVSMNLSYALEGCLCEIEGFNFSHWKDRQGNAIYELYVVESKYYFVGVWEENT